jgi:hypothetical protein
MRFAFRARRWWPEAAGKDEEGALGTAQRRGQVGGIAQVGHRHLCAALAPSLALPRLPDQDPTLRC